MQGMFIDTLRTAGNNVEGLGLWESEIIGRFVVFILQTEVSLVVLEARVVYFILGACRDVH
jgi:hypothetical protein